MTEVSELFEEWIKDPENQKAYAKAGKKMKIEIKLFKQHKQRGEYVQSLRERRVLRYQIKAQEMRARNDKARKEREQNLKL